MTDKQRLVGGRRVAEETHLAVMRVRQTRLVAIFLEM